MDVWGGFDAGARRPLTWLAQAGAWRTDGPLGAACLFTASDRHDRTTAGSAAAVREDVRDALDARVLAPHGYRGTVFPFEWPVVHGRTMQTYARGVSV